MSILIDNFIKKSLKILYDLAKHENSAGFYSLAISIEEPIAFTYKQNRIFSNMKNKMNKYSFQKLSIFAEKKT